MKRCTMLFALLLLAGTLLAKLPAEFYPAQNPELYKSLKPKAEKNLSLLPKAQKKAYQKLLKAEDNILMAFLLAYESDANLAQAKPEDILSNYRQIALLLEQEGLQYPLDFFLSYIAKQSVSDERISAYRKAMLDDGLAEVLRDFPDPLERYRAAASWCVEKLQFQQTSGRDQNPLDITERSLVGRCEEMQILFVAAARTVGLPSRPASTPWWAHIDNNHAWAEVYLDGAWAYTGDMDAAYHPNQTWFSGLIDKTVLILADGSMETAQDEVLARGKYEILINSTPNYAGERSRKLELSVLDSQGAALENAEISIMVYNWGALRALTTILSDQGGKASFSVGRGAFYLSIYKSGEQALVAVPSSEAEKIELTVQLDKDLPLVQNEILYYPANEMEWLQAPESYNEDVRQRKELWQDNIQAWEAVALKDAPPDSLKQELLKAAKGNYREMRKFLKQEPKVKKAFMEFLLSYDPKYLWQADAAHLSALYQHFKRYYEADEDYPAQRYYPTVFYEELSTAYKVKGKWHLYPPELIVKADSDRNKLAKVMDSLHKKHKIKPQKALQGLLCFDIAYKSKYLTNYQFRILAIAALRANGIAAEYTRVPDKILVYMDEDWQYYDVLRRGFEQESPELPGKNICLRILDDEGAPLKLPPEQLHLSRYLKGAFYDLNNRFEYKGDGKYQSTLRDKDAYLFFGYRISQSETAVQLLPLADWDGISEITLNALRYPKSWQEADGELLALFDADTLDTAELILLGNYDQENSLRIRDRIGKRPHLFFGYAKSPSGVAGYTVLDSWSQMVKENSANKHRSLTFRKKDGKWLYYEGFWEKLPE
ncbi:MAG: transglutaminase-like domain-containing protein [Candidatus Cloacimonetes bacterium]|nr:transglutaminase-like domain-containing protein [Candidatus Cloacimonadota bacterium]